MVLRFALTGLQVIIWPKTRYGLEYNGITADINSTFTKPSSRVRDSIAAPLESALKPVGVHGRQDVEVGRLEDLSLEPEDVLGQVDEELAADGLVAVHVGHHLHHRTQKLFFALKRWKCSKRRWKPLKWTCGGKNDPLEVSSLFFQLKSICHYLDEGNMPLGGMYI